MNVDPTASQLAREGVTFASSIAGAARRHGIDPRLLAAVAAQETGGPGVNGGRNVVGDGGHGRGLFQIDDRWHAFAATPAAMDPDRNADYAAGMLHELLARYGNVREALSAYNAGDPHAAGTRTDWPDGRRRDYADSVLRHYELIADAVPAAAQAAGLAPAVQPGAGLLVPQAAPPQLEPQPQQSYHRQETDYAGLFDSDDSTTA